MRTHTEAPHPADIKAAVEKRKANLTRIALDAGIPEASCRVALRWPHEAGERALAAFLRVAPQDLWPHRYEPDGTRRRHLYSSHAKHTAAQHGAERQNERAA